MRLLVFRLITIVLAAAGLSLGLAHVFEMPVKMRYDPQMYLAVTSTLYRYFGAVGAVVQVGTLICVIVLCWLVRRRRGFRWTVASAIAIALSLVLWTALVQPVNVAWGRALRDNPLGAADAYVQLRPRWEYGHVAACAAWLAGFASLVQSVLVEIPTEPR